MNVYKLPEPGEIWKGKNERLYFVYFITNTSPVSRERPPMVVFGDLESGDKFSSPLGEWYDNFERLEPQP